MARSWRAMFASSRTTPTTRRWAARRRRFRMKREEKVAPASRGLTERPVAMLVGTSRSNRSGARWTRHGDPCISSASFRSSAVTGRADFIAAFRSDAKLHAGLFLRAALWASSGVSVRLGSDRQGRSGSPKRCRTSRSSRSVARTEVATSSERPIKV